MKVFVILLIDDLKYIQENDKTLFKQVLDFSKMKVIIL